METFNIIKEISFIVPKDYEPIHYQNTVELTTKTPHRIYAEVMDNKLRGAASLLAGKKYLCKILLIDETENFSCSLQNLQDYLLKQNVLFIGNQGVLLAFKEFRKELPVYGYYNSFENLFVPYKYDNSLPYLHFRSDEDGCVIRTTNINADNLPYLLNSFVLCFCEA